MKAFSGLGIGLSLVFGCLLLALATEVYYLLRWKKNKKKCIRIISQETEEEGEGEENNGYAKDLIQLFCFKKPSSIQPNSNGVGDETGRNPEGNFHEIEEDLELGANKDMVLMKTLSSGDGGFEAELMKFHNHRFLFTIEEETKEDLESDDGKSRKGTTRSSRRSPSDLALVMNDNNTPNFLTPLASPTLKSAALEHYSYPRHGFINPLSDSEGELEFNKFRSSSPPPKFKFLIDAEEKLRRRLMEEAKKRDVSSSSPTPIYPNPELLTEIEGSFLKFMKSAMNREKQNLRELREIVSSSPSSSSQVLPLATSPTKLKTPEQKPTVH